MRPFRIAVALALSVALPAFVQAQTMGYNNSTLVPLIADTPSYASRIYVHNASPNPSVVGFTYYGATTSASAGLLQCAPLPVPPGTVLATSLGQVCPGLSPGANFGALLAEPGAQMAIYARTQTPTGHGFSIDAVDTCCNGIREVIGLVRQAAPPAYQTNCFVLNEESRAGRVVATLATGDGQAIAALLVDLQPNEFIRMLDVFAVLGAPPGDYDNVRASFESIVPVGGGFPVAFAASCTVQNNTTFDADFRIAKWH